jgi:hypothetical protein
VPCMMEAQAGSGMGCGYGGEIPMSSNCDDNFPICYSELTIILDAFAGHVPCWRLLGSAI